MTVRASDCAARLGGDEFVVLRGGIAGPDDPETLARRIVDLVGRAYVIEGHLVAIGASVGVSLASPDSAAPGQLYRHADLALYRAKSDGRATLRFFEPAMDARLQEIGLIVPIGEWVLRTACREAARWPGTLTVAVNLSPAQFKSRKLVSVVESALADSGLAPNRLELEITEGVLLHENESNLETLHERARALAAALCRDPAEDGHHAPAQAGRGAEAATRKGAA